MSASEVLGYRGIIERKLESKLSELGTTEKSLKSYGRPMPTTREHRTNLFNNRLGPATRNGSGGDAMLRRPVTNRLGPKSAVMEQNGSGDQKSILSRVVIEQKSREEALAEQKFDKKEVMRNKRMFGSIMGTLQGFARDENRGKERERKKREIERKIELRTELEKEEAVKEKRGLLDDRRRKQREIKALQLQMERVEEFEVWERSKRREQKFIRTSKGDGGAAVYFLPKQHSDETLKALEESRNGVEEEILAAREAFERELHKINARVENPDKSVEDGDESDEDDDEEEDGPKQASVVVSAVQRPGGIDRRAARSRSPEKNLQRALEIESRAEAAASSGRHVQRSHQEGNALLQTRQQRRNSEGQQQQRSLLHHEERHSFQRRNSGEQQHPQQQKAADEKRPLQREPEVKRPPKKKPRKDSSDEGGSSSDSSSDDGSSSGSSDDSSSSDSSGSSGRRRRDKSRRQRKDRNSDSD